MHRLFAPALIDCLRSGATPTREQLASVATHIWRDWCVTSGFDGTNTPPDQARATCMRSLAWLALTGSADGPPSHWGDTGFCADESLRQLDMAC